MILNEMVNHKEICHLEAFLQSNGSQMMHVPARE
jgi:hypothetical protein